MTAQEVQKIQPGEEIYWALGKRFIKGKFLKFSRDVLDIKSLIVVDEKGIEDEILHVMLVDKETYLDAIQKTNKQKIIQNTSFIQSKIVKKEEISDEEIIEEISEKKEIITENQEDQKTEITIPVTPSIINPQQLSKVSSPRGNNSDIKPNLSTLQKLLNSQGYNIERDPNKWVRYILTMPDGEVTNFIFKGKVWELYNIYIDKGIQGFLDLK
jgi:DNA polymerase III delta prime subunit